MEQPITKDEIKSYYFELQEKIKDTRHLRGIRHDLAFVLANMTVAILRSVGKLNLSVIHRQMKREYSEVSKSIGIECKKVVSDPQLRRLLSMVDYNTYNEVNASYFKISIVKFEGEWKAIDGKEMRGSIDGVMGQKRGENVVRAVSHEDKHSQILGFYNGSKESEKTVVKEYFQQQKHLESSYTFDALHTNADLLHEIDRKGGVYLAQVKKNQLHLLEECEHMDLTMPVAEKHETFDKGHGREEQRKARLYSMSVSGLEERWLNTNIQTLLVIEREVRQSKNNKKSLEIAYFVTNKALGKLVGLELFHAARGHWNIEVDNYIRDVTFGEDGIRCKEPNRMRMIASAINITLNIFRKFDISNNIRAFREELIFDRNKAIACLSVS